MRIKDTDAPKWALIAERHRQYRDAQVSSYSEVLMGKSVPFLPDPSRKDVRQWPVESGHLTSKQQEITSSLPTKILNMIAKGFWTAEEVLIAFLIRTVIAHHLTNPLSDVFFDKGLSRARELDEIYRKTGKVVGPLHGLPMSLKDVLHMKGHATNLGFIAFADNIQSSSDRLVTHLYDAGAVFFCKTNVPQSLMSGECNNPLFGRTATPDNILLSAGGSSGGEGSLIALRGSPLGIGTDIAGSIRTPANFNGIYGLCPTFGRFPCHSAEFSSLGLINGVAGPLSTSLDGLELYARTILSFEPWNWDAMCNNYPWNENLYSETINRAASRQLCFGFVADDGIVRPDPPIRRGMKETKEALLSAGHKVVDINLFHANDAMGECATRISSADGGLGLRQTLAILGEPLMKETMMPIESMALTASQLEAESRTLLNIRQTILRRWQETAPLTGTGRPVDVFIMPSGGHVAPPHGTMTYFLYEAISNVIDWPCATIPVGTVDPALDPRPTPGELDPPLSDQDLENREKYSPEAYENGAICLQVLGPRYKEEVVLAALRVVDESLGRGKDHML